MASENEGKRQLTRDDWVEAAMERLVTMGVDAVRVEPLAASIGVSRGSFYWHFKSRQDLLEAILLRWRDTQTRRIVERIKEDRRLGPREQLGRLRTLPSRTRRSEDAATVELAIRAWARRDKMARRMVLEVDRERVGFSSSLMLEGGATPGDAEHLAFLGYAYSLGEALLRDVASEEVLERCRDLIRDAQVAALSTPEADTDDGGSTAP